MPVNLQEANFQDLLAAYYRGSRAQTAASYLKSEIERERHLHLANLLRDHRERGIYSPEEIDLRAAVDDLMILYDVLEIASISGFIAQPQASDFWRETQLVLENRQVRNFYSQFYPLKLPQLLRYRLQRRQCAVEQDAPSLGSMVIQFLDLDRRFMTTLNDCSFLRMLDSFRIDGYRFNNIVDLIRTPAEFIRCILLAPEKRRTPEIAVQEFSLFLQFSFDLHQLLGRMDGHQLLQSAIWNHYSYWFGIIGDQLKRRLSSALNQFLSWNPDLESQSAAAEIRAYVAQAQHVLNALTSPAYAVPVDSQLRDVLDA